MRSLRKKGRGDARAPAAAESAPAPAIHAVDACDYRRFGDDHALLTIELRGGVETLPDGVRLAPAPGSTHSEAAPCVVTTASGSARLLFVVGREVAPSADRIVELLVGPATLALPAPEELQPIGGPTGARFEDAVSATLKGEELTALLSLFERRAAAAERIVEESRATAEYPQRLAQAYREAAELRSLIDSREAAHREGAAAIAAAESARTEADERLAAAEAAREELRAEYERSTAELSEELDLRAQAIEALEHELAECRGALDAWALEAAHAGEQLAEAVSRAESIAEQRDDLRAQLDATQAERDGAVAEVAESTGRLQATRDELTDARRELDEATARLDTLSDERDEARRLADTLERKLGASQELLAEGDGRFDAQRTLYEARIASAAESDAKLRRRIDALEARLGGSRSLGDRALQNREQRAQALADAHRSQVSDATLEEQRAQVAALEQQLEQIRQRADGPSPDRLVVR